MPSGPTMNLPGTSRPTGIRLTLLHPETAAARLLAYSRNDEPTLPTEPSHLNRAKPAGHSDDPSRMAVRFTSGWIGPPGGILLKPGCGGSQLSHALLS